MLKHKSFDLLLALFYEVLRTLRIDVDVFALAIDYLVRGERRHHLANGLPAFKETLHQRVVGNPQGLESPAGAAQDSPDSRNDLARAVAHRSIFRNHLFDVRCHLAELCHYPVIDTDYFSRSVGADEYTVVLEEYDLRLAALLLAVSLDLVIYLLEKGISRVGVSHIDGLREQFGTEALSLGRAHKAIDESRMEVYHIRRFHTVVEGCLHRRAPVLRQAGVGQVILYLSFALRHVGTVFLFSHRVEKAPVKHCETVLGDGGKGVAAGLDPKPVSILE